LLRYWKQYRQPPMIGTVPGLPLNDVIIEARVLDGASEGAKR